MSLEIITIESPGLGASLQDLGMVGWRKYGVPPGGAMDTHAAIYANRLLDNPDQAPVLEMLLQGGRLRLLQDAWIAVTGADVTIPGGPRPWHAFPARADSVFSFTKNLCGVWIYLAVAGGFDSECPRHQTQMYPRGLLGQPLEPGQSLKRRAPGHFALPQGVAGRWVAGEEQRRYEAIPPLRLWPGPQWEGFGKKDRKTFFESDWTVTSQSNRVGYRLEGPPLHPPADQMLSEPVQVGSVQVPANGQPIVTMRDGPTVGGYPKIGVVDPQDLPWLSQCRPGQALRFTLTRHVKSTTPIP